MKFIGDLIPKRRPAPGAVRLSGVQAAARVPAVTEPDLAMDADQRDRQRAQTGRDRVPLACTEPQRPERQTMGDAPKEAFGGSARGDGAPQEARPAAAAPAIWDLEGDPTDLPPPPRPSAAAASAEPVRAQRAASAQQAAPGHPAAPGPAPAPALAPAAAPSPEPARVPPLAINPPRDGASDRVRTRLIGFGAAPQADAFATEATRAGETRFPIGWLVVIEGAGRGASFTLTSGLSTIGRGADQAVRLDFGDTAISRECHAAVAYDPEERRVLVGHGGRSNIVRLNGDPLLSREELHDGDLIRLGKTTLRFVGFCGPEFDWEDGEEGEAHE